MLAPKLIRKDMATCLEDRPDEELLEQFLGGEEFDSQDAFRALVVRHGPMVLGICRHILNQEHDAEDAFQATFLVLARRGSSIRDRRVLAGWLHEVAYRIAVKARGGAARRRSVERQSVAMLPPAIEPDRQDEEAAWNELRPVLHEEVNRLPDKYRVPVILSYLEGKTNEEVAEMLRWPVGTVKGRLSRARDVLRSRLMRRGLTLSAAFLMTSLSRGRVFAEVVSSDLVARTVRFATGIGPAPSSASTSNEPSTPPELASAADHRGGPGRRPDTPDPRPRRWFGRTLFSLALFAVTLGLGVGTTLAFQGQGINDLKAMLSAFKSVRSQKAAQVGGARVARAAAAAAVEYPSCHED